MLTRESLWAICRTTFILIAWLRALLFHLQINSKVDYQVQLARDLQASYFMSIQYIIQKLHHFCTTVYTASVSIRTLIKAQNLTLVLLSMMSELIRGITYVK